MKTRAENILSSGNLRGMMWMVLSGLCFAANYAVIRHLAADIHVLEMVFFRNLFGLMVLIPFIWRIRHTIRRPKSWSIIFGRGVLQTGASGLWYYGVTLIPLAMATSLMMIEPIVGSMLAILLLKEPNHMSRWMAVGVGLLGALIIVRPGLIEVSVGSAAIIVAAILWSGYLLLGKIQSRDDPVSLVVAYASAITVPLSLIPVLFFWVTPNFEQFLWLILMGAVATGGYVCLTNAYKLGDVTIVSPLTFTRTIFAAIVGFLVFAEVPEIWVWIGSIVIVASNTNLARQEIRAGRN